MLIFVLVLKDSLRTFFKSLSLSLGSGPCPCPCGSGPSPCPGPCGSGPCPSPGPCGLVLVSVRFAGGVRGVLPPCFFFDPPASSRPPGGGRLDPSNLLPVILYTKQLNNNQLA